jgi:hypothetical protein
MQTCTVIVDFRACYRNHIDNVSIARSDEVRDQGLGHAQPAEDVGVVPVRKVNATNGIT